MSKEIGGMVRSKWVKGIGSARPESAPTARRLARAPWRPRSGASPPFSDAEVATMSATTSATTGRRYGPQPTRVLAGKKERHRRDSNQGRC